MKYFIIFTSLLLPVGCQQVNSMSLSFSSYRSTPSLITHFAIEGPLGPIPPTISSGSADKPIRSRSAGGSALSAPRDVGKDGVWLVSAQWVELTTDRAWQAEIQVPIDDITIWHNTYIVQIITGPNGLLLIGSDNPGGTDVDVARTCGQRIPEADKAWRLEVGYFPEMPIVMRDRPPVDPNPECPNPAEN